MASTAWIVVFNIILIINSITSNPSDLRSRCYCGFIENVCPANLMNLRYLYNSILSTPCASNEVKYCNIPDGSISETCGQRKITVMRNKRSGEAQVGEYPWQAVILKRNQNGGYVYIGSGVLINRKHVLTVVQKVDSFRQSDLVIRLGEWDLSSSEETCAQQDYQPMKIIKHPNYNSDTIENNIALIILDRNVPLATTAHINTACLPSGLPIFGRCLVAGWGGSQELTPEGSKLLRDLSVPIRDHAECQRSIQTILGENYRLPESVLCAGEGKMDSCMIDGGSPLVCQSSSGQWEVVGLVSASTGCQQNVPSLYTDVSKFTSWINKQVFEHY